MSPWQHIESRYQSSHQEFLNNFIKTFSMHTQSLSHWVIENRLPILEPCYLPGSLEAIEVFTQYFPDDLTPFWGYEIPLGNERIIPDFLFCVDSAWKLYEAFLPLPDQATHPLLDLHPIFNRYFDLASYWLQHQKEGESPVNNVWFEFDYRDIEKRTFAPNFFFAPTVHQSDALLEDTQAISSIMGGQLLDRKILQTLSSIHQALPRVGQISQIGQMLARDDHHLRLFIQSISEQDLPHFLREIAYPHAMDAPFKSLLQSLQELSTRVDINLDIHHQVGSAIGLELYFHEIPQVLDVMNFFQEHDLIRPTLQEALTNHVLQLKLSPNKPFQHFFSHFKVVYHPNHPLKAKAYIAFARQHLVSRLIYLNLPQSL